LQLPDKLTLVDFRCIVKTNEKQEELVLDGQRLLEQYSHYQLISIDKTG
jgi:hypothetical protein